MKKIIVLLILGVSCTYSNPKKIGSEKLTDSAGLKHKVDSMVRVDIQEAFFRDTMNEAKAPIKILSVRPVAGKDSMRTAVELTFKNISDKKVTSIRFSWYSANSIADSADKNINNGFGGGISAGDIAPGEIHTATLSTLYKNLQTVIKAWPTEIIFKDGTNWKPGDQ